MKAAPHPQLEAVHGAAARIAHQENALMLTDTE